MENLKRCSKCVLPETHETIMFNDAGVCNVCEQQDVKNEFVDWECKKEGV